MDKHQIFANLAQKYGISIGAVQEMAGALQRGNMTMAQFNHPDLGGMGQWMQGGMTMVGDMFNNQLKYTVDSLCNDLVFQINQNPNAFAPPPSTNQNNATWYPSHLGIPSASGSQNNSQYAYFPHVNRLAVQINGTTCVYDTTGYNVYGFGQQQAGTGFITISTQMGQMLLTQFPMLNM